MNYDVKVAEYLFSFALIFGAVLAGFLVYKWHQHDKKLGIG